MYALKTPPKQGGGREGHRKQIANSPTCAIVDRKNNGIIIQLATTSIDPDPTNPIKLRR